jgi:phosphatidylglycerophosphate synthase
MPERISVTVDGVQLDTLPIVGGLLSRRSVLRGITDALPIARGLSGPVIAKKIYETPPSERSALFMAGVAALAYTDRVDGIIAKQIGTTKLGAMLDHMADKAFVLPGMTALAARGEISWGHPATKLARDVGVIGIKHVLAERNGGDYASAIDLARIKATAEMGALAIGCGPLAAYRSTETGTTLTELGFRASTALTVVTGAQYTQQLIESLRGGGLSDIEDLVTKQALSED